MAARTCAACGAQNTADAVFCARCGSRIARKCPSCDAVVAADAAFCTSCGTALEPGPALATEERKTVTVLFADRVGFTAQAEKLDPEDVRALLDAFHVRVRADVERFGGTMEKYVGDAVMALFGAPIAHEDDPERAVRAALAIRDGAAELDTSVRVGVTTGEALVTRSARPLEGEGMAAGDVVNTASRLQSAAGANAILVDTATKRATEHAIEYTDVQPVRAKGKSEPVEAWEVVAPKARMGVDIAFRGGAPLVGRDDELDALRDAFARARRDRTAQLVTLVGEPGLGKSRLVYELWCVLEREPDLVYWRQGRSLPYGGGVSYWALGEMVKAQAGILESDDADQSSTKLRDAVSRAVRDPAEAAWTEQHLRPLVGLASRTDASPPRDQAFTAWRRFLEALAEERPLVLVFEDVHWADDGLLDFVDHLADWATGVPLLVVCTARPELLDRRPSWGGGKRNAVTISLAPLADSAIGELVHALVGEEHGELASHAGGNPLYAEEYARIVAASGGGGLELPETVHGIIAARLDTLPLEEKALVQDAAVLGKVFWAGELAHVAQLNGELEDRLRALERKEFVRRERRSSVTGETAYVFRHVLVRDVAYGQIPRPRRMDKHRLAAEWIESLAGDRREDLADVIAHHYVSALELARATGSDTAELEERARHALRDAGDRATGLRAVEAAERFYAEALALWPEDDPERPDLLLRYGRALCPQGRGEDVLAEAAEELLDAGAREAAAEAETLLGDVLWLHAHRSEAFEHLEAAVALLEHAPPSYEKALVLANLARFRMMGDEAAAAIASGSRALELAEKLELEDLKASALNTLGVCRVLTGDRRGLDDLERSIEISRGRVSQQLVRGFNNLASTLYALGDLDAAIVHYAEAREAARRAGWSAMLFWLDASEMDASYHRGDWDAALRAAAAMIEKAQGRGHVREFDARIIRALIELERGEDGAADDDSAAAMAIESSEDPQLLFPALACRARVLAETARLEQAQPLVEELLRRWGANPVTFATSWVADLAPALILCGRHSELAAIAERTPMPTLWLEAALALPDAPLVAAQTYARIGSLPNEAHARVRAAGALGAAGRASEARVEADKALEFYRRVGAVRMIAEAELLAASVTR